MGKRTYALLLDVFPEARNIWDDEKNNEDIAHVAHRANRKLHWVCNKGHTYMHYPKYIIDHQGECPYCAGLWVIPGETDFFAYQPHLLRAWDIQKNGYEVPRNLLPGTCKKFWFICDKGHSFQQSPA